MAIQDISYAQPYINYEVYAQHTDGAILRTGQGAYADANQVLFKSHYENFVRLKILRGLFHFHQPEQRGILQAKKFVEILKTLPYVPKRNFIDVEDISYNIYDKDGNLIEHIGIFPPSREFHTLALMEWCDIYFQETGLTLGFYTRSDYWNSWVVPSNTEFWYGGVKYKTPDWSKHPLWIASWYNYVPGLEPRLPRDWTTWALHQYEGGTGRTEGILDYWGNLGPVDQNRFNGTHEEMLAYFEGEEFHMTAAMYNKEVLQEKRARLIQVDATAKSANSQLIQAGVDAVVLKMGGMDGVKGSGNELYQESGYDVRVKQFNALKTPLIALFNLDAGYWLWKQKDLNTGAGSGIEQMAGEDNPIIKQILYQLSLGNVNALMFDMGVDVTHTGAFIPDVWQKGTLLNMIDKILVMQAKGTFPKLPLLVQTDPWFLDEYPSEFSTYLTNKRNDIYVVIKDYTGFPATAGPHVETLKLAFDTWYPANTFKPHNIPFGYYKDEMGNTDRIMAHQFTSKRFFVDNLMVDGAGKTVPLTMFLWSDTREEMLNFLGEAVVTPPPVEPPVEPPPANTDLEKRVTALENNLLVTVSSTNRQLAELGVKINQLETELAATKELVTKLVSWKNLGL